MIESFLLWLDADLARFHAVVWIAFALCAALAVSRLRWTRAWNSAPVFAIAVLLALLAHRWPFALDGKRSLIPDEAHIVADALAYARDPVPFRSVDTNTAGPLTSLSLVAFAGVTGRPIDLVTARLVGLGCIWLILLAVWRVLAVATTEARARLLMLPALPIIGGAYNFDMMQFNTEHVPSALLLVGTWALAPLFDHKRWISSVRLVVAALLIGAAPLAKPQVAPITLVLALSGLVLRWRHPLLRAGRTRAVALYAAGGLLPVFAIFGSCAVAGAWDDMWASFIRNNLSYAGARHYPWSDSFQTVIRVVRVAETLMPFYVATLVAVPVTLLGLRWFDPAVRRLAIVALAMFLAAWFAVIAPGKQFAHYLVLLFGPGSLLLGAAVAGWLSIAARAKTRTEPAQRTENTPLTRSAIGAIWALWFFGVMLPTPWLHAHLPPRGFGEFHQPDPDEAGIVSSVRRFTQAGEPLAVWGWSPWLFVWLQQPHATREAVAERQISAWSDAAFYRRRFVADLARTRPTVFIDTAGPHDFRYTDRTSSRYEQFPELRRFIAVNYAIVEDSKLVRIYVRRDKLPPPAPLNLAPLLSPVPDGFAASTPEPTTLTEPGLVVFAHAPCVMVWKPIARKRHATFSFGINPEASRNGNATNGVEFNVVAVRPDGQAEVLFSRFLNPVAVAADRSVQEGSAEIPAGAHVLFETMPGPNTNDAWDWSFWRSIALRAEE